MEIHKKLAQISTKYPDGHTKRQFVTYYETSFLNYS